MKNKFSKYVSVFLVALFVSTIKAQTNAGSIDGSIVDHDGAAVPNAVVKAALIDENNKWEKIIISNSEGRFNLSNLPFGMYELEISVDWIANKVKKQIEIKSEKPVQTNITFSLESCSDENSNTSSESLTDNDKAEIVRQMLNIFLENYSNFLIDKQRKSKLILSTKNIKSEWLTDKEKQKFELMEQADIQNSADKRKDFPYLSFSEFKIRGKCVAISLSNGWAVGVNSGMGYLSGGGITYEFRKVENRWIGKFIIGWIS